MFFFLFTEKNLRRREALLQGGGLHMNIFFRTQIVLSLFELLLLNILQEIMANTNTKHLGEKRERRLGHGTWM